MYHWIEDKEFLHNLRRFSGALMQELCHELKVQYDIGAIAYLVGSGAKNLITQNENNPIDLDYNLEIVRCEDYDDCRTLKENVRNAFNHVLRGYRLRDCNDSKSVLTTNWMFFNSDYEQVSNYNYVMFSNQMVFKLDVCIVRRDDRDNSYRLIHDKTGYTYLDQYHWDLTPNAKKLRQKVEYIKDMGKWSLLRDEYINIKNMYLVRNDHDHPSFICYIEAVNTVYNSIKNK